MEKFSKSDITALKKSGQILKEALSVVSDKAKPGVSGAYLNNIAEEIIRMRGGKPSFLNYSSTGEEPFPASLCVSINENVVHGIPTSNQIIKEGDVVSLDLGVKYQGLCTDSAVTIIAGETYDQNHQKLVEVTKKSLEVGIKQVKAGNTTGDIGNAIENYVSGKGFTIVKSLVGHGIGKEPHQEPQVPNFGKKRSGAKLIENTAIAIEPMVVIGKRDLKTDQDGWSIITVDKSISAHFEHTVLITKNGHVKIT